MLHFRDNSPHSVNLIKQSCLVQALPWLQLAALQSAEEERKRRVRRLEMEKAAAEGKGFGPPPRPGTDGSAPVCKVSCVCYRL